MIAGSRVMAPAASCPYGTKRLDPAIADDTAFIDFRSDNPGAGGPEVRRLAIGRLQRLERISLATAAPSRSLSAWDRARARRKASASPPRGSEGRGRPPGSGSARCMRTRGQGCRHEEPQGVQCIEGDKPSCPNDCPRLRITESTYKQ
jgi:hypothetical protein